MDREAFLLGYHSVLLEKKSFLMPSWGGQSWVTKRKLGLRGEAGYDYALGAVPLPFLGLSVGGDKYNVGVSGPLPGISFGGGLPGEYSGRVKHMPNSIWKGLSNAVKERKKK